MMNAGNPFGSLLTLSSPILEVIVTVSLHSKIIIVIIIKSHVENVTIKGENMSNNFKYILIGVLSTSALIVLAASGPGTYAASADRGANVLNLSASHAGA